MFDVTWFEAAVALVLLGLLVWSVKRLLAPVFGRRRTGRRAGDAEREWDDAVLRDDRG